MKNSWLLSLAPLLLVVSSSLPVTAAGQSPVVECIGHGVYAANSTYEANLRRLAAFLTAEVSANPGENHTYIDRAVGYWPNRMMASFYCWRHRYKDGGSPCADCIAGAFLEVERACPYRKEAFYSDGNCTLELEEIRIFGTGRPSFEESIHILKQDMSPALVLQAIGFACLFFLLFQEWRSRKRGSLINSTPLLSGD